jgi:hypothetical protein
VVGPDTFCQPDAACGLDDESILVWDFGNGTCLSAYYPTSGPSQIGTCSTEVFGRECTVLAASLTIRITNEAASDALFVLPDINKWLTNMGLANLAAIKNELSIRVYEGLRTIPVPIAPVFFTSLREARSLVISEICLLPTCNGQYDLPPVSRLTALPGLIGLKQLYRPAGSDPIYNTLLLSGTAFTDMRSFVGLTCPPTYFELYNNTQLKSLDGLQQLASPVSGSAGISAVGSGPFTRAESVAPLKGLAACKGDFAETLLDNTVYVPAGCGTVLSDWDDVCAFKGTPSLCAPG